MFFSIQGPPSAAFQRYSDAFLVLYGIIVSIMSLDHACKIFSRGEISHSDAIFGGVLIVLGIFSSGVAIMMIVATIWGFFRKKWRARRRNLHGS